MGLISHLLSNISESMSLSQLHPETVLSLQPVKFFQLHRTKDLKYGFGCNCGFDHNMEKSL